jgi:hypothetical protein
VAAAGGDRALMWLWCAATPHNLHSPIVAKRIKGLFPNAKVMAVLKEPAWRMHSAYNQFSKPFINACTTGRPADWCPVFRYYALRLPTFHEVRPCPACACLPGSSLQLPHYSASCRRPSRRSSTCRRQVLPSSSAGL